MHECQTGQKVLHYSGPKLHHSPWRLSLRRSQGSGRVVAPDGLLNASLSGLGLFNEHRSAHRSTGHRCATLQGQPTAPQSPPPPCLFIVPRLCSAGPPPFTPATTCQHATEDEGRIRPRCDAISHRPDLFVPSAPPSNISGCWLALQLRNLCLPAGLVGRYFNIYFIYFLMGDSILNQRYFLCWNSTWKILLFHRHSRI